jgi:hypothetical protein
MGNGLGNMLGRCELASTLWLCSADCAENIRRSVTNLELNWM